MSRHDRILRPDQEELRIRYSTNAIYKAGFNPEWNEEQQRIEFIYKGSLVYHYPYTGWHTGKQIKDGRGINKLIKQIIK